MMLQSDSPGRFGAFLKNGLATRNELWPKVPEVAIAEVILQEAVIDDVQDLEFRVTRAGRLIASLRARRAHGLSSMATRTC
jgi:hypothetical protein